MGFYIDILNMIIIINYIVWIYRTKINQEGSNRKIPYHITPCLSVVLMLGVYLISNPGIIMNRTGARLFPAEFQYNRIEKSLKE